MKKHGLLVLLVAAPLLLQPWVMMLAQEPSGCALPLPDGAYWMSSPFGMRSVNGVPRMHMGLDLACSVGTRVHAAAGGVVAFAGRWGCYGEVVILRHPGDVVTLYAHLSRIAPNLRPGMSVRAGQVIALSGESGCVRGVRPGHLHFEVWQAGKRINPMLVCASVLPRPSKRSRTVEVN